MVNGTHDGPTIEEIDECDETVEVNRAALERLQLIANDALPQNGYDRCAIYTIRDALE